MKQPAMSTVAYKSHHILLPPLMTMTIRVSHVTKGISQRHQGRGLSPNASNNFQSSWIVALRRTSSSSVKSETRTVFIWFAFLNCNKVKKGAVQFAKIGKTLGSIMIMLLCCYCSIYLEDLCSCERQMVQKRKRENDAEPDACKCSSLTDVRFMSISSSAVRAPFGAANLVVR